MTTDRVIKTAYAMAVGALCGVLIDGLFLSMITGVLIVLVCNLAGWILGDDN